MSLCAIVAGVWGLVFGLAGVARVVHAGSGQLVAQKNMAGDFVQGAIQAKLYVDLPRSQEQLDLMMIQLRATNQLICDYTDGRFRLEKVEFVNHPAEKKNAD